MNPLLSGIARTPGAAGADIVCAEAQPLGIPLNAGGPYLGAVATRQEYRGFLPGRIVGEVFDLKGEPALALVHEEREQHVSRDRATSHICSNQALMALRVVLRLSLLGEQGFARVASLATTKAHAYVDRLCAHPGVTRVHDGPFFNECLIRLPVPAAPVLAHLQAEGIFGGVDWQRFDPAVRDCLLIAVTEQHSASDLERGTGIADPDFEPNPAALQSWLPDGEARAQSLDLPEVSEIDVVRHFTLQSHESHGVDTGSYPRGSCTMKYNPKRNDRVAMLDGFRYAHPLQPVETLQGVWDTLADLQDAIAELTGMDAVSLQPAAGAHGEFAGLLAMQRYFAERGEARRVILIPDSAHGTNPASAAMVGFECRIISTTSNGLMDLTSFHSMLGPDVAGLMLTNPSTLGLFEENIIEIADAVHAAGALLYYDGANLNALMGIVRPGDMGFDVVHVNTHKTLSTPHGGGGPGSGPWGEGVPRALPAGAGCVHFGPDYRTAMLIEPTETESKAALDLTIEGFRKVANEAAVAPFMIETAPHTTPVAKIVQNEAAWLSVLEPEQPAPDPIEEAQA